MGEKIYNWIVERLNEGRTCYATTYLRSIKITKKNLDAGLVRLHNGHCEIARGKQWDSINFCKITAA